MTTLLSRTALACLLPLLFTACGDSKPGAPGMPEPARVAFSADLPPAIAQATLVFNSQCNMETLNDAPWGNETLTLPKGAPFKVAGWGVVDVAKSVQADTVYVRLHSADGRVYVANAARTQRADVAQYFNNPFYEASGYEVNGDVTALPAGEYAATLLMTHPGGVTLCDSGRRVTLQ